MLFYAATRDDIRGPRKGGMFNQDCAMAVLRAPGYPLLFSCVTLDKPFYLFEPVSCENHKTCFTQTFLQSNGIMYAKL